MRRRILALHRGLTWVAGLLVAVICLSGTASQYRGELVRWACSAPVARQSDAAADPAAVAVALTARYPGYRVSQWTVGASPNDPDAWQVKWPSGGGHSQSLTVFTDPGTGAWLGDTAGSTVAAVLQSTYTFHHMLWISGWGRWLVGATGAVLALLVVTGSGLSWPFLAAWWRQGLLRGWRSGGDRLMTWHVRLGLLAAPLLLLIGVTGVLNGGIKIWQPALLAASERLARAELVEASVGTPPDWTRVVAISAQALPGTALAVVAAPRHGDPTPAWTVVRRWPGAWGPRDGAVVRLHPGTGAVLGVQDPRVLPGGALLSQQLGFHVGWCAGPAGRLLWAIVGLLPLVLLISGLVRWWRHGRRQRRRP